jgi:hypothetical protein
VRRTAEFVFEAATSVGYGFQTNGVDELVIVMPHPSRLPQNSEAFRSFQKAIHEHGPEIIDLVVKHGRRA